ncbi:sensor histidine kinase [Flavihumibacter sp. R14]|nr:sensor histidine kinase [Flavihumibacter soli]
MKEFIIKPGHLSRIELWAGTTIYVFAVFFLVTTTSPAEERHYFDKAHIAFDFFDNYLFPQLATYTAVYLTFLLLNFRVVPALVRKENILLNTFIIAGLLMLLGLCLGIVGTYSRAYLFGVYPKEDDFNAYIFNLSYRDAFSILFMFGVYSMIKYSSVYLLSNSEAISSKFSIITRDALIAFILWMISVFILLLGDLDSELVICWVVLIPFAILFYCYSCYKLLPVAFGKKRPFMAYLLKSLLLMALAFIPIAAIILLFTNDEEVGFGGSFFNAAFQLLITAPMSWVLYKRRLQGNQEINVLQKALGKSNANLDFLRSQINPHFLFNALNTIYATAINEKAERTSEAVEKLGEMMRFMLHENVQDKISLAREIEYLNNYIGLQKLRTEHNPVLTIEAHIEQNLDPHYIAPMLLIPFVENAFKHGISFRENSLIRIVLEVKDKTLNFDVYNSKHEKPEHDPEKNKSGIGLNNVKQRLQLLYPGRHELTIRETGKEFFIHLTVQLS